MGGGGAGGDMGLFAWSDMLLTMNTVSDLASAS